jgi:hypothetical protein
MDLLLVADILKFEITSAGHPFVGTPMLWTMLRQSHQIPVHSGPMWCGNAQDDNQDTLEPLIGLDALPALSRHRMGDTSAEQEGNIISKDAPHDLCGRPRRAG